MHPGTTARKPRSKRNSLVPSRPPTGRFPHTRDRQSPIDRGVETVSPRVELLDSPIVSETISSDCTYFPCPQTVLKHIFIISSLAVKGLRIHLRHRSSILRQDKAHPSWDMFHERHSPGTYCTPSTARSSRKHPEPPPPTHCRDTYRREIYQVPPGKRITTARDEVSSLPGPARPHYNTQYAGAWALPKRGKDPTSVYIIIHCKPTYYAVQDRRAAERPSDGDDASTLDPVFCPVPCRAVGGGAREGEKRVCASCPARNREKRWETDG